MSADPNILTDIQNLQQQEKNLYAELDTLGGEENKEQQDAIIQQINELTDARITLLNELTSSFSTANDVLDKSRRSLKSELSLVGVVEDELNKVRIKCICEEFTRRAEIKDLINEIEELKHIVGIRTSYLESDIYDLECDIYELKTIKNEHRDTLRDLLKGHYELLDRIEKLEKTQKLHNDILKELKKIKYLQK